MLAWLRARGFTVDLAPGDRIHIRPAPSPGLTARIMARRAGLLRELRDEALPSDWPRCPRCRGGLLFRTAAGPDADPPLGKWECAGGGLPEGRAVELLGLSTSGEALTVLNVLATDAAPDDLIQQFGIPIALAPSRVRPIPCWRGEQ
jgi:hypothetical protein